jgi:putative transposase
MCDIGEAPEKRAVNTMTGIDLGLKEFAVLSDGEAIANPRHFKNGAESLARAQRVLARKQRGSNSRHRARQAVARAHSRIANQRLDFHRKTAKQLCTRFDLIAHEALNVRGLSRGMLSKSVHDAGWGSFLRILHSKAEEAGVHVVAVDPRHTTQACSACGTLVPKGLGDRVHACACGLVLDRDHNAAINILARGLRASPAETSDRAQRVDHGQ